MKTKENQLISIPISHYCEKARWGLEWAEIPYAEVRHLPVFHYWPAYCSAKSKSVPVLITSDGVFADSTHILKWCDIKADERRKLYPKEPSLRREVEQFEDYLDEGFGVAGRLWMYSFLLDQMPLLLHYSKIHGVPRYQLKLLPVIFPIIKGRMYKALGI